MRQARRRYDLHLDEPSLLGGRCRRGNNRSVMPLDVPGRTRATLSAAASLLGFPLAGKLDLATAFVLGKDGCNCSS